MGIIDRPIRFTGTAEQAAANRGTHHFIDYGDGEVECGDCFCKPWHAAASYPCGTEPPREVVTYGSG